MTRSTGAAKLAGVVALSLALLVAWVTATGSAAVLLGVPDRANAFASIAASQDLVVVAWAGTTADGASDVYTAVSRDGGRRFAAPARVTRAGGVNASGEQPVRVALIPRASGDPALVVVWTARSDGGTRLFSARSTDGGKSFGPQALVPGTDAPGNRGWESVAVSGDGSVAAIWLDHRGTVTAAAGASGGGSHHDHLAARQNKVDSVARAQLSQLFFGRVDGAATARSLASGVCYCCKTALAADAGKGVYAAWRHVYAGNVRDIAFTRSTDGGRTFAAPVRVSQDNWVLDGCPENGPAIAVDRRGRVHIAWPTLVPGATPDNPTLALFYARSEDGSHFTPRQQIPTNGFPRHVQIVPGPGDAISVAWDEQSPGSRRVAFARGTVDPAGSVRFARQPVTDAAAAAYPILAAQADETVMAWTSGPTGRTMIKVTRLGK
jgi:hypothetical protein